MDQCLTQHLLTSSHHIPTRIFERRKWILRRPAVICIRHSWPSTAQICLASAGVSCVYAVYCRNSASVFGKTRTPGLHFSIFTASIGLHYLLAQITDARLALLQACCHQRTCSRYAYGAHRALVQRRRLSGLMAMPPWTILATIPSATSAHALASDASTMIGSLALT